MVQVLKPCSSLPDAFAVSLPPPPSSHPHCKHLFLAPATKGGIRSPSSATSIVRRRRIAKKAESQVQGTQSRSPPPSSLVFRHKKCLPPLSATTHSVFPAKTEKNNCSALQEIHLAAKEFLFCPFSSSSFRYFYFQWVKLSVGRSMNSPTTLHSVRNVWWVHCTVPHCYSKAAASIRTKLPSSLPLLLRLFGAKNVGGRSECVLPPPLFSLTDAVGQWLILPGSNLLAVGINFKCVQRIKGYFAS